LVQVEQASSRFVGLPLCGTVDVQTALVVPTIQIWGFIKAEGTLRVFFKYTLYTVYDDI
jgi:hypothetical protein